MLDVFLEFYTDDAEAIKLACDYWSLSEDGNWQYFQKDLIAATGMRRAQFLRLIESAGFAVCRDIRCIKCDRPYILHDRTLPRLEAFKNWQCPTCTQAQLDEARRQEAEKEAIELQRMAAILEVLKSDNEPYDYTTTPYYQAIVVCSIMIQSAEACENGRIGMMQNLGLSSTDDLARKLAANLHSAGILRFGESTTEKALAWTSKDANDYNYWALLVDWRFAPPAAGLTFTQVLRHLNIFIEAEKGSEDFILAVKALWWDLAKDCIESYLRIQLNQYGIRDLKIGDKFREALNYLLERFSVPKARYIVYRVARNVAALSTKVGFTRAHAINTIPGSIIRDCDRALADGWNIKGYTVRWDTEEPQLFTFIFDRLLGTGIVGYQITSGRLLDQILENIWAEARGVSSGSGMVQ